MNNLKFSEYIFFAIILVWIIFLERIIYKLTGLGFWSILLAVLLTLVVQLFIRDYIEKILIKIDNEVAKRFNANRFFSLLQLCFAFIGFIWLINFAFNRESYRLVVSSLEINKIELIEKGNWGLTEKTYEVKYINGQWKYKRLKDGKPSWDPLPSGIDIHENAY